MAGFVIAILVLWPLMVLVGLGAMAYAILWCLVQVCEECIPPLLHWMEQLGHGPAMRVRAAWRRLTWRWRVWRTYEAAIREIAAVRAEHVATPALMMRHELTLARLYVEARLECAARGWELTWRNTRMLELERLGIEPDAWLGVGAGEGGQEAFVEFTAAMPGAAELANKLARYQAHWEGTRRPAAVLWLTTSRARAHRLLDAVRAVAYRDYFLVGLIEDTGRFITRPMWRWGAGEGVWGDVVSWMQAPAE
jgi:hypothetical protein